MFTLPRKKSFLIRFLFIPPSDIFPIMSVDPFQWKTIHSAGSSNRTPEHYRPSAMTSLFRPWAEDTASPSEGITTVIPEDSSRESKYRSVKEHMKKRSEKYLLKKGRVRGNREAEVKEEKPLGVTPGAFPVCYPPEGYLPGWDCWGGSIPEMSLSCGILEEYAKFLTEQQRIVSERNRKQRPKKFRCPHCHVGFSNNGQLKGHIRIHTGERPFKCDAESCGKSFTRNEELTRHRRIHSGLRPFPCPECGKRFGRKDHLKKHVKTHFQQRYQLVPILPSHCPYFYGL